MNQDDIIIKMAREAGAGEPESLFGRTDYVVMTRYDLERFTALVISHHVKENRPKPNATEREWLQQIAYQHGGIGDLCQTELEFGAMVAAAEREACARTAENWDSDSADPRDIADAIRARGGKK